MLLVIDLAPQGGSLEGTAAQIESERGQGIEPPVPERHGDQPQHRPLGDRNVVPE